MEIIKIKSQVFKLFYNVNKKFKLINFNEKSVLTNSMEGRHLYLAGSKPSK